MASRTLATWQNDRTARLDRLEATAKTHVSRVLTKLDLRSRVQAAILAQEVGLTRDRPAVARRSSALRRQESMV